VKIPQTVTADITMTMIIIPHPYTIFYYSGYTCTCYVITDIMRITVKNTTKNNKVHTCKCVTTEQTTMTASNDNFKTQQQSII